MKTSKKKVNFLTKRKPYIRRHTVQTVLLKEMPKTELYAICGTGGCSSSCSSSCGTGSCGSCSCGSDG